MPDCAVPRGTTLASASLVRAVVCLLSLVIVACGVSKRHGEGTDETPRGDESIEHGYTPYRCELGSYGEGCECRELSPGGARTCVGNTTETCGSDEDACCSSEECASGQHCISVPGYTGTCCTDSDCDGGGTCRIVETIGVGYCFVGTPTDPHKACVNDACSSDADCPGGFCTVPLWAGARSCIQGCRSDAECDRRPGGVCTLVTPGCPSCREEPFRAACTYPGDGCTVSAECPDGTVCSIEGGFAACRPGVCEAP